MPYDPNFPASHAELTSPAFRGQFNGLKDLIDAIVTIVAAQIAGVSTLNPGDPASATAAVVGDTLHFTFAIPRGADGAQGPPFAQAIVDAVNTLAPGSNATVSVSFDGTNVHLTFGIPAGMPGEVSNAALAAALAGTSANTNAVATLDTPFTNDPPTLADMEVLRAKLNEFILAARQV